jgi:membrane-associated protein
VDLVDLFLHLDKHLAVLVASYGVWIYAILFTIIFCETGLVVTPFLPGDSLVFATGALAATGAMSFPLVMGLMLVAAILGDTVNYWIGSKVGPRVFRGENVRFLNRKHLEKTHEFFEKYGGKTIIIARFVPIVRTFAPFVAGMGSMTYSRFFLFNVVGAILWIGLCGFAGYLFGNMPIVKKNFSLVILGIIFISILPGVFEYINHRRSQKAA